MTTNRDKWLAERRTGIGGSDVAGVRATSSQPHMAAADEAIKRWLRQ